MSAIVTGTGLTERVIQRDVMIYNPQYQQYLFVSGDMDHEDHIVEAHTGAAEQRNHFDLLDAGEGLVKILCHYQKGDLYLFVSEAKDGNDWMVEAHVNADDPRNKFKIEPGDAGSYRIYCPKKDARLFVSGTLRGGDNVVEARPGMMENRSIFQLFTQLTGPIVPTQK